MKRVLLILFCAPAMLVAQTTHEVEAFGGGLGNPDPQYVPQFITINVGDFVHWENTQGKHNVWGELDVFPNNPEGFSSGAPEFAPWDYTFEFTIPGFYEYHCEFMDHSDTQFGSITVVDPNSVGDIEVDPVSYQIFPNPTSEIVNIRFEGRQIDHIEVVDMNGKLIRTINDLSGIEHTFDVSDLSTGRYIMTVFTEDDRKYNGPLIIE